jgi:uncharacterized OB-fold protein
MTVFRCSNCGSTYVRRPAYCRCGGADFEPKEISGQGRIYSCTTLYAAAEPFEKDLPFQIAIVELDGGARLTARIKGRRVDVGDPVRCIEQRDGVYFFSAI